MQPTSQPQIHTPQYTQPKSSIGFNVKYIKSVTGIITAFLILFLFMGFVSAAAVPKTQYLSQPRSPTENAYLFFAVVAFIIEVALYVLNLLSVFDLDVFQRFRFMNVVYIVKDAILCVSLFGLSISCAVQETNQRNSAVYDSTVYNQYNQGAFAAAAFFGFFITALYIVHCFFCTLEFVRGGSSDSTN